jgi:hypothetical protein
MGVQQMSISRRFFVVGSSGLITASFLKEAKAAVADTGGPLLIAPKNPVQDMFVEWTDEGGRLHLGTPALTAPPAPLLIDHLKACGEELETAKQIVAYCDFTGFDEEDLWNPMDGYAWEDYWEACGSSEAKAYELLWNAKLVPKLRRLTCDGSLIFQWRPNPMSSAQWVEVHDPLSLSLLQAQLNGLDLGIAVKDLPENLYP